MNVYTTLHANSVIPDPLSAFSEYNLRWIAETDWVLQGLYVGLPLIGKNVLHFDWIDTLGDIYVDSILVGRSNNSFLPWEFPITDNIRNVSVHIHSSVNFAANLFDHESSSVCAEWQFCGVEHVRTAQSQFGWDWGPAYPNIGMGSVSVTPAVKKVRVLIDTKMVGDHTWTVQLRVPMETCDTSLFVTVATSDGAEIYSQNVHMKNWADFWCVGEFTVGNISQWDPRGYGFSNMYVCNVCIVGGVCVGAEFGFREVSMGPHGLLFVNSRPVEILGTNLVPTDAFRGTEGLKELINFVLDQGLNLIRVWGGGHWGSELLYELANRHGIMIWEEMKFACAVYEHFDEEEILHNIYNIYNNPSFVVISGDNEIALMLEQNWFKWSKSVLAKKRQIYLDFSKQVLHTLNGIAGIVHTANPTSTDGVEHTISPISENSVHLFGDGGRFVIIPSSPTAGVDVHFYDTSSDCRDIDTFPKRVGLVSEYGYQSWSMDFATLDISVITSRQHKEGGTEAIIRQARRIFKIDTPISVEDLVWVSQLVQAICLKSATETFRRTSRSGIMYWQLNDVWPTVSWSLIEHKPQRPKLGYYYLKSSFDQNFVSIFLHKKYLVLETKLALIPPVRVINIHTNKVTLLENLSKVHIKHLHCTPACIAAISMFNYILISSSEEKLQLYSGKPPHITHNTPHNVTVTVSRATPFIYLYCNGGIFEQNSFFLEAGQSITVSHTKCDGPVLVKAL